ncbi:hypothetical protein [uncultured Paraglaciecola sp.]|nr:hypothetical protein [uncultured Paraglaciecola sp.]
MQPAKVSKLLDETFCPREDYFACRAFFLDKYATALAGLKGKVQGLTL